MYDCAPVMCLVPTEARRVRSPEDGVTNGFELQYGCWESYLGPLEGQPVLLTTEPSLQLPIAHSYGGVFSSEVSSSRMTSSQVDIKLASPV